MICPYKKSIHTVEITEEIEDKTIHTVREDYVHEQCLKENCGAWHDGKCEFKRG